MNAVTVTRTSDTTLVLAPDGGYLLEPWSTLVRRADEPFPADYRVQIAEMTIEIARRTPDGRPAAIRCLLPGMGAEQFVWVVWNSEADRYERVALPAVGERMRIAAEADPEMQLDAPELR
jgi:hypothetical protein